MTVREHLQAILDYEGTLPMGIKVHADAALEDLNNSREATEKVTRPWQLPGDDNHIQFEVKNHKARIVLDD